VDSSHKGAIGDVAAKQSPINAAKQSTPGNAPPPLRRGQYPSSNGTGHVKMQQVNSACDCPVFSIDSLLILLALVQNTEWSRNKPELLFLKSNMFLFAVLIKSSAEHTTASTLHAD